MFLFDLAFNQLAGHLHTHAEHGLGYLDVLALQERLGIFRKIQGYQRPLVLGAAQLDATVRQLYNF